MTDTTPAPETPAANVPVASPASAPAPVAQPEPPVAQQQPAESAEPGPEASQSDKPEGDGRPESKRPASERIAQLTAEKRTAQARAAMAERNARRLADEVRALTERAGNPDLPIEQQDAYRLRQVVKVENLEQAAVAAENARIEAHEARVRTFEAKVESVRDRMPDFDQVFDDTVPIDSVMAEMIADSDKGAEIAYYLGKNRAEAAQIARLPPHMKGAAMARIEAKVSLAPRKVSTAPAPVPMVGGGSAPLVKDPANMTMAEYDVAYRQREGLG